jgi:hypothetical protein
METALKVLASQSPLRDAIRDLLAQAQDAINTGNQQRARRALEIATAFINTAKRQKVPAPNEYFAHTVNALDDLKRGASQGAQLALGEARRARVALAEYRSSLDPSTVPVGGVPLKDTAIVTTQLVQLPASVFDGSRLPKGADMFGYPDKPPFLRTLASASTFQDLTLKNATQTLDGFRWVNVAFVNMHIRYRGGAVEIKNVIFVNCTLEFTDTPRTDTLASVIALRLGSAIIS